MKKVYFTQGVPFKAVTTDHAPRRPVATYSIVAMDSKTSQLGVAVQSHWFSVGSIVSWAEAGVGAIATQSMVDPAYGPLGLELMRAGKNAPDALNGLLVSDQSQDVRQVAMIDAQGRVEAYTGKRAISAAGHIVGENFSVQANLMDKNTVWPAMAKAYKNAEGDLAERLLKTLEAAEKEGGDIRGKQSAAIIVVAGKNTGRPWADRIFDLRVEDHSEPLKELRRLVTLQRVYLKLNKGDDWIAKGDMGKAMQEYLEATQIVPDSATNGEAVFWTGVSLARANRVDEAILYLKRAYHQDKRWARLIPRLLASQLLPDKPKLVEHLVKGMKKE